VHDERGQVDHVAQARCLFKGYEKLPKGIPVPARHVDISRAARRQRVEDELAPEIIAAFAVGPAVFQYHVDPLLEQGRRPVHVQGMLPDDDLVVEKEFFFPLHVHVEIGVFLVKVVKGDACQV